MGTRIITLLLINSIISLSPVLATYGSSESENESLAITSDPPFETAADHQSVTLEWETDTPGHSLVKYGTTTNYELGKVIVEESDSRHEVTLEGLDPATIYQISVGAAADQDTVWSANKIISSGSHEEATREVNVYFNGSIYEDAARSQKANANHDLTRHYIERIQQARESIDITFYNLSQEAGAKVTDALIAASRIGLNIRVVMHHNLSSQARQNRDRLIDQPGIEVIQSDAGPNESRSGLMHNKFAIFDYESDNPEDVWVVVSSWNTTDAGSFDQYQNMIEFQDPALAGGYRAEFNQMFGSDELSPSASDARFSRNKEVVNPTRFWIGDKELNLFFSPQANSEQHIINYLQTAEHDIALPTYLITRSEYVDALEDLHENDIQVRGAIGDPSYHSDLFDRLTGFADVHDHSKATDFEGESYPLLHHKSALIDPMNPESGNGHVITGSMNWSRNGNEFSDENTLVIRDDDITNLYFQEFAARYFEAGGSDELTLVSTVDEIDSAPQEFELRQNYPNPFNPVTTINFKLPKAEVVDLEIFDTIGRHVATLMDGKQLNKGNHAVEFNGSSIPSGTYIYHLRLSNGQSISRTMTLIK